MAKSALNDLFADMQAVKKVEPEKKESKAPAKKEAPSKKEQKAEPKPAKTEEAKPVEKPTEAKDSKPKAKDIFSSKTTRTYHNHTFYIPDDLFEKMEESAKDHELSISIVLTTIPDNFYE